MTAIGESRALRAARNQSLFREVNERIEALNEEFARILPMGDWICECADDACFETMSFTIDEYEAIRSNPARFPVVPATSYRMWNRSWRNTSATSLWRRSETPGRSPSSLTHDDRTRMSHPTAT